MVTFLNIKQSTCTNGDHEVLSMGWYSCELNVALL